VIHVSISDESVYIVPCSFRDCHSGLCQHFFVWK